MNESVFASALFVLVPIAASVFMAFGSTLADRGDWAWFAGGVSMLVVLALVEVYRRHLRWVILELESDVAGAFRVLLKGALQPVAEMLADMQLLQKADRRAKLEAVAGQCCGALVLLLKDIQHLRAVVYQVDNPLASPVVMSKLGYSTTRGGPPPQPFVQGTPRGDAALVTIQSRSPCRVEDVLDPVEVRLANGAYFGTRSGYRTFISVPINDQSNVYGMVTVDAPEAGDLTDTDQQLVMLIADMMAIAFASVR